MTGTNEPKKAIESLFKMFRGISEPYVRVVALACTVGAFFYTPFKEKGISLDKIFIVNIADKKLEELLFDVVDGGICLPIDAPQRDVFKAMVSTKDAPLVFEADNAAIAGENTLKNIRSLQSVCCGRACIPYMDKEYKPQSMVIIKSDNIFYYIQQGKSSSMGIDSSNFITVEIDEECFGYENYKVRKEVYGDFIMIILKYAPEFFPVLENRYEEYVVKSKNIFGFDPKYINAYAFLSATLEIINMIFEKKFDFSLDNLLAISTDANEPAYQVALNNFFSNLSQSDVDIADYFFEILENSVEGADESDESKLTEVIGKTVPYEKKDRGCILVDKDEVLIRHRDIEKYVINKMGNCFKTKNVLKELAQRNIIKSIKMPKSDGGSENVYTFLKRISYINENGIKEKKDERFVVIDPQYYRAKCDVKPMKEKIATNKDSWQKLREEYSNEDFSNYAEENNTAERYTKYRLGKGYITGNTIYTNCSQNGHVSVIGNSGSGKTYTLSNLICQAVEEKGISCMAIDVGDSFSQRHIEPEIKALLSDKIVEYDVEKDGIPLTVLDENIDVYEIAGRIASLIDKLSNLGPKQKDFVKEYAQKALEEERSGEDILKRIIEKIEAAAVAMKKTERDNTKPILARLKEISGGLKFICVGTNWWDKLLYGKGSKLVVFQLTQLDEDTARIAADILQEGLIMHIKARETQEDLVLILDEIQKINTSEKAPVSRLLTECRKYGVYLWYATQFKGFDSNNPSFVKVFNQAATKVVLNSGEDDTNKVVKILERSDSDAFGKLNVKDIIKDMGRETGRAIVYGNGTSNELDNLVLINKIGR